MVSSKSRHRLFTLLSPPNGWILKSVGGNCDRDSFLPWLSVEASTLFLTIYQKIVHTFVWRIPFPQGTTRGQTHGHPDVKVSPGPAQRWMSTVMDTGNASVDTKMAIDTIRSRNFQLEKSSTTCSFSSLSPAFSNSPAISFNWNWQVIIENVVRDISRIEKTPHSQPRGK